MTEYRQIPAFNLERLRNTTHLEAVTDIKDVIIANPALAAYFSVAIAQFIAKVAEEKAALEESTKSQYTEPITKKDTERDSTLDVVKTLIRNFSLIGTGAQQQAAQFLYSMAKIMKVKANEQYDKETGAITVAVDELLGKYLSYTESAGIKPYVEQLKQLNDEMCELLITRDTERGEQGKSKVAAARAESDKTYRELTRQVNALEIAFAIGQLRDEPETNPFSGFVSFMLGLIDRYNREILRTPSSSTTKPGTSEEVTEEVEEDVTETETPDNKPGQGGNGENNENGSNNENNGSNTGNGGSNNENTGGTPPEEDDPNMPPPGSGGSGFE